MFLYWQRAFHLCIFSFLYNYNYTFISVVHRRVSSGYKIVIESEQGNALGKCAQFRTLPDFYSPTLICRSRGVSNTIVEFLRGLIWFPWRSPSPWPLSVRCHHPPSPAPLPLLVWWIGVGVNTNIEIGIYNWDILPLPLPIRHWGLRGGGLWLEGKEILKGWVESQWDRMSPWEAKRFL